MDAPSLERGVRQVRRSYPLSALPYPPRLPWCGCSIARPRDTPILHAALSLLHPDCNDLERPRPKLTEPTVPRTQRTHARAVRGGAEQAPARVLRVRPHAERRGTRVSKVADCGDHRELMRVRYAHANGCEATPQFYAPVVRTPLPSLRCWTSRTELMMGETLRGSSSRSGRAARSKQSTWRASSCASCRRWRTGGRAQGAQKAFPQRAGEDRVQCHLRQVQPRRAWVAEVGSARRVCRDRTLMAGANRRTFVYLTGVDECSSS